MTDTPDKIDFIQRRVWIDRYEVIPRRRQDKRIFDRLTPKMEDAFNLIEEAHGYEMAGLPASRMQYAERTDKGHDWELTPRQIDAVLSYREWVAHTRTKAPASLFAVLAYMTGGSVLTISQRLKTRRSEIASIIFVGLNEYCILKNWGNQLHDNRAPIKIRGISNDLAVFRASEFDELGRPVAFVKKVPEKV